ncbi:hypothetical protein GX865_03020 [Candidatus Saccharibacteria bacterium]|jgi:hypothetical protein|nr:hypothetical protein [Candidatus Saccharibacteria bacterium]
MVGLPASALETTPTVDLKPTSPLLLTEFRTDNSMISYIQLFNNGSEAQYVADWELVAEYEDGRFSYSLPEGYIVPGKYLVVSLPNVVVGEDVEELIGVEELKRSDQFRLVSKHSKYEPENIPIATSVSGARYHRYKSTAGNHTGTRTFSIIKD